MLIATFNVNSLKARLPILIQWLNFKKPDVIMLQEIKGTEDIFPSLEISDLGYKYSYALQKTYNGVATLSLKNIEIINSALPNFNDPQARYLETKINDIIFINIYVPNGNPIGTDKYTYKLNWLDSLYNRILHLLNTHEDFIVAGDFNIIPYDYDVYNTESFKHDALFQDEVRKKFFKLLNLGLTDCIDICYPKEKERYTWWDYRNNGFAKNRGLRIDHILLSPKIASKLVDSGIDKTLRTEERPSDHTIVYCNLSIL